MSRDGHWWGSCGCWWLQLESIVSFWDGFLTWPMVAFGSTHRSAFQRSSDQAELFCALAIGDLTRICHGQQHRACWFPLSICQKPSTLTNLLWRMDQSFWSFEGRLCSLADSALKKAVRWRFQRNPPFEKMVKKLGALSFLLIECLLDELLVLGLTDCFTPKHLWSCDMMHLSKLACGDTKFDTTSGCLDKTPSTSWNLWKFQTRTFAATAISSCEVGSSSNAWTLTSWIHHYIISRKHLKKNAQRK